MASEQRRFPGITIHVHSPTCVFHDGSWTFSGRDKVWDYERGSPILDALDIPVVFRNCPTDNGASERDIWSQSG